MPPQQQNKIPPEELYRQPGAIDHDKKSWFTIHHALGYTLLGLIFVAIVIGVYYYQLSNTVIPSVCDSQRGTRCGQKDETPKSSLPISAFAVITPDSVTAGWKTYSNTEHQYEFKYPTNINTSKENPFIQIDKDSYINIYSDPKLNFDDEYNQDTKYLDEYKFLLVSGIKSVQYKDGSNAPLALSTIFFGTNSTITAGYIGSGSSSQLKLYNQILSTFKFTDTINSFEACAAAGYPIMESFPEKCRTPEGLTFIKYENCIQVIQPAKNPATGEVRQFPTPCDVPDGWENVETSS